MKLIAIFTTTNSKKEAKSIAKTLLKENLCACVNIVKIYRSIYRWENNIKKDKEFLLIIKTKKKLFKKLKNKLSSIHSYDTPEIISFGIKKANKDYLEWINSTTKID